MALIAQNVPIPLSHGLNTKTDSKQLVVGELTTLENGYFKNINSLNKCPGFSEIGSNTALSSGNTVASFLDELVICDSQSLYSYSSQENKKNLKGTKVAVDLSVQSLVRNTYQQTTGDSAYNSSLLCSAWEDTQGGVRYSVLDTTTGQCIVVNSQVSATGVKPKVKAIGSFLVIFFGESSTNNLRYVSISTSTPQTLSAAASLATDFDIANPNYDVCLLANKLYVAWNNSSGSSISLKTMDTSLTISAETTVAGNNATGSLSIFADSVLSQVWVVFGTSSNAMKYFVRNSALSSVLAATSIESLSVIPRNVTGIASNGSATIWYENTATSNSNTFIKKATLTNAGVVSGIAVFLRSVGLASKAFTVSSTQYMVVTHDSSLQQMYFVVNSSGAVVTKIAAPGNGGGLTAKSILAEVNNPSTNVYQFTYLIKDLLTSVNGNVFTQTGLNLATLTFNAPLVEQTLGNNLHLSGGVLTMYDGGQVVEHGFHLFPEDLTIPAVYPTGGGLTTGQYQWEANYEWTDNQGQIHRSAPSVAVTQTIADPAVVGSVTSGSAVVSALVPNNDLIFPGMVVTSTHTPASTRVSTLDATTITLTANETGSSLVENLSFQPAYTIPIEFNQNSTAAYFQQLQYLYIYGAITSGSNQLTVADSSMLGVNYTVESLQGYLPANTTISSISGNTITLSANATTTKTMVALRISKQFTGTITFGTNTVTSINATGISLCSVGAQVIGTGFNFWSSTNFIVPTITAVGVSSITLNEPAILGSGGGVTIYAYFPASLVLKTGMALSMATYLPTGCTITSITSGLTTFSLKQMTQVTLSEPSLVSTYTQGQSVTVSGLNSVQVQIPTLRLTQKSNANLVLYRSASNGVLFYRSSSVTSPTFNDTTVDSVTMLDTTTDGTLVGNQQLYTTGGVVENIAPPAIAWIAKYKNRLILIPSEQPYSWWYSKEVIPGSPVEFSDVFVENFNQAGTTLVASAEMDDKLIFFTDFHQYYLVGQGPSATGANNDFTTPLQVPTDVGCADKKSVVTTPVGTFFKSANGIYQLDRALQNTYIGAPVEAYNSSTVSSAHLVPGFTHVRFTLASGSVALVYDYLVGKWSTFTGVNAQDATIFQNLFTHITPSGQVNQETLSTFTQNGSFIKMKAVIGWLSLVGVQGYKRLYELMVLGEYKSPHSLVVSLGYDFISTNTQVTTISVPSQPSTSYQFKIENTRQKCEALQVTIEDSQSSAFGEGFSLSNIALRVGVKKGLNKVPAAQSAS